MQQFKQGKALLCLLVSILFVEGSWVQAVTIPPGPDNAALLYYQAFLDLPQSNDTIDEALDRVRQGEEPDSIARNYLDQCQRVFEMVDDASKIPSCTWGLRFRPEYTDAFYPGVRAKLRKIILIIPPDIKIKTWDGDYSQALQRSLTLYRLAGHISNDSSGWHLFSLASGNLAYQSMCDILGSMPADANQIQWLQGQLDYGYDWHRSLVHPFEVECECLSQELLSVCPESYDTFNRLQTEYRNGVLRILNLRMPYEKTYAELSAIEDTYFHQFLTQLQDVAVQYPLALFAAYPVSDLYSLDIGTEAHCKICTIAIELYRILAQEGALPGVLPEDLPKDPFSGLAFEYEITDTGFLLRCPGLDLYKNKHQEYKFSIYVPPTQ